MRIGLVFFSAAPTGPLAEYAKAIAAGMESMGHRVDSIDARTDEGRTLPGYEYLVVLSEPVSFFSGKVPPALLKYLAHASSLLGKKSAAFLRASGLFSGKAMSALMRAMEKEGMCVNWSEIVANTVQSTAVAKRIGA